MLSDCRKKVTVEGSASEPEVFGKFSGNPWTLLNSVQNCNGSFVHSPEEHILRFHDRLTPHTLLSKILETVIWCWETVKWPFEHQIIWTYHRKGAS